MISKEECGARSPEDFCRWAGIGLTTFYEEKRAGRLKVKKIGRRNVILDEDGREWLASLPPAPVTMEAA